MGKENNTKQYDNINKTLFIGQKVKHISFGEGTIAEIKDGFIFVDFYNKPMRQFDFPSVFSSYLAPVSDYITNFVKELYGNHTCLRCGVAIINGSKKTICDRCKSKLKICPICKNKAFVKSVDEVNRYRSRYEEEYLICSNCFNKYYNKEETTNDKNVDSENSEGRTSLETNRANKINKNYQYITVYAISCHCLSCERNNHFPRMIPYSIEVESMRKRVLDLPVERCNICGRFYINEVVIEKFEKDYGVYLLSENMRRNVKSPRIHPDMGMQMIPF